MEGSSCNELDSWTLTGMSLIYDIIIVTQQILKGYDSKT